MNLALNARDACRRRPLTMTTTNVTVEGTSQANVPWRHRRLRRPDRERHGLRHGRADSSRASSAFFTTKAIGRGVVWGSRRSRHRDQSGGRSGGQRAGGGSTFTIYWLAVDDPIPPLEPSKAYEAFGVETILVVEDEEGSRRRLQALGFNGYSVLQPVMVARPWRCRSATRAHPSARTTSSCRT